MRNDWTQQKVLMMGLIFKIASSYILCWSSFYFSNKLFITFHDCVSEAFLRVPLITYIRGLRP